MHVVGQQKTTLSKTCSLVKYSLYAKQKVFLGFKPPNKSYSLLYNRPDFFYINNYTPCNTENPAKWLFVTPYKSTMNQLVEEVIVTASS